MKYYFSIAGIRVKWDVPFPFRIGKDTTPFFNDEMQNVDEEIRFLPIENYERNDCGHWEETDCFCEKKIFRYLLKTEMPYAIMDWQTRICRYDEKKVSCLWCSGNIWNAIGVECLLLRHNRIILHSSFVKYQEKAILFSAPSGTGKSTQAKLWQDCLNAEVVNGDRTALSCEKGIWTAWGIPYAGSSGIYKNEAAPLAAMIVLRQAKENRIERLNNIQALSALMAEFTLHRWDKEFMECAMSIILRLIKEIPVYLLECRPNEEAVELVKKTLKKGEM